MGFQECFDGSSGRLTVSQATETPLKTQVRISVALETVVQVWYVFKGVLMVLVAD